MSKGRVFIISGPSGSGKDTVLKEVFAIDPTVKFSISTVSRPMRQGEKEGEKYHFISRELFQSLLKEDAFLEYNVYADNYYGTPKKPVLDAVEKGENIILEIDVNGAEKIRRIIPDAVSIFIMPPSYKELKRRLSSRGTETAEVIEKRLKIALDEIKRAKEYDFIVKNDVISVAANDILHIINADKLKFERQEDFINEVLEKC